jgi:fructose-bisphosphate aldolase class II
MALVTLKEILKESIEKKYAVGAFNTFDHTITEAILAGAEAKGKPVIINVGWFSSIPHCDLYFKYMIMRCEASSVPVCINLDHGPSFEEAMKAIHYGCTSVMIDGSSLPFSENVALTKKVVEAAHACGVSVEAEIGHVAGHKGDMMGGQVADETKFTKLEDAVRFAEETGIDALAIAIGTVHGVYKGEPKLDYDRITAIRNAVSIPLVMHGGSGLAAEQYKEAVACGINKINYATYMMLGAGEAMIKFVEERSRKLLSQEIVAVGSKRISEIVSEQIENFGTQALTL